MALPGSTWILAVVCLLAGRADAGVLIPASSNLGVPSADGTGLLGQFWDVPEGDSVVVISEALAASSGAPTATFLAASIDYPNGSANAVSTDTLVSEFLGADAASLSPGPAGDVRVLNSVFLLSGMINILADDDLDTTTSGIDVLFRVGSDDGFRLTIGGVVLSEYDALRSFSYSSEVATFEKAGLYAISLLYFEGSASEAGLELASSIGSSSTDPVVVPTARLYPAAVPEPSSLAMVTLGFLGAAIVARRRRRRSA